jgi:glycosyltransferase involved in cell wall biosynthesis
MKVCHITSMHVWDDDRIYQRACLGLIREGIKVQLVAAKPDQLPLDSRVSFYWIKSRFSWKRRWFSSIEAVEKAINVKADIYHFHDPDLLPHVLKIKSKLPKSKVVYDIHENYAGRFQNWGLPSFLGTLFRKYEKFIISKIDGFTVISESMNKLFKNLKTPSIVIRNSTDISRLSGIDFKSIKKYNSPAIYTSGTNSHARHCLQTVKALKYIEYKKPYQMLFAGKYEKGMKGELMNQAKDDKTSDILRIDSMLSWEENFKRTAKAYCGCVFYEDNPNNRVGIPNRLFEYIYCGLPIVATDFPELRKIIEDTKCGILVNSEDPKSIAKGFNFLLNNPDEATKMGELGKKAIEKKYGYHIDLENTINFYKKLIG